MNEFLFCDNAKFAKQEIKGNILEIAIILNLLMFIIAWQLGVINKTVIVITVEVVVEI